jgi:hypothetical protein
MFGLEDNTFDTFFALAESIVVAHIEDGIASAESGIAMAQRKLARLKKQKVMLAKVTAGYRKNQTEQHRKWKVETNKFKKAQRRMHKNAAGLYGAPVMTVPSVGPKR